MYGDKSREPRGEKGPQCLNTAGEPRGGMSVGCSHGDFLLKSRYPREPSDGRRAGDVEIREGGEPGKYVREVKGGGLREQW